MVAEFNGKPPAKPAPAADPTGKPTQAQAKKIESRYSQQKAVGGSAYSGSQGQFNK